MSPTQHVTLQSLTQLTELPEQVYVNQHYLVYQMDAKRITANNMITMNKDS